ncbi:MAG: signal peptidase I [Candidatus Omnitrophica bacterium]|nr:signal peptidase I [Candidatus Omnitrophota bacterium]HOX54430.1 signal peptidase I [Candidatus Omnitrophota bacterium]
MPKEIKKKSAAREWIESIVIAIILAMFIRTFIVQAFKIPTGSMRPTLLEGDRILVNKFIYGAKIPFTKIRLPKFRDPKRLDVVVFIYPEDKKRDFIKRLIAKGGETVELKNGEIFVDGKKLDDSLVRKIYYYNRGDFGEEGKTIKVPENSYFVLGDNSVSSRDSRYWGFVDKNLVLGNAILIYWPLNRIRLIK